MHAPTAAAPKSARSEKLRTKMGDDGCSEVRSASWNIANVTAPAMALKNNSLHWARGGADKKSLLFHPSRARRGGLVQTQCWCPRDVGYVVCTWLAFFQFSSGFFFVRRCEKVANWMPQGMTGCCF